MNIQERVSIQTRLFAQDLHQIPAQADIQIINRHINRSQQRLSRQIPQFNRIGIITGRIGYARGQSQNQRFGILPVKTTGNTETITLGTFAVGYVLAKHTVIHIQPGLFQITVTIPNEFVEHTVFEITEIGVFV